MKTKYFKITTLLLAALFCFSFNPANARKTTRHYKRKVSARRNIPSADLATMKVKNIEFGFNKATIPDNAHENLDRVAKLMADNSASVKLGGYADNKGGYVYNWMLSKARAQSVKAYLISKGADSARIAATEYGYTHPIASNKTPIGRKKNRRVEVQFAN